MLKKIVLLIFILGLPLGFWLALQYGELQVLHFSQAVEMARGKTEAEQTKKLLIKGYVLIDEQHPVERQEGTGLRFYMRDEKMTDFLVSYDGTDEVGELKHMQTVSVAGHAHDGNPPWFHCSKVIIGY